ncbi:unnamed protein product [Ambrosiozyma monospora]|uniref:Unnamed protein product n=1 Tax=Ambrosiozyma monospora TaxID=43982 RepID=A0ACB5TC48_AMBMO|nr:unnamed protein product [Ambrosiozyma monospora]
MYYFLSSLKPTNQQIEKPNASVLLQTPDINEKITNVPTLDLVKWIDTSFGSLEEFKTLFLSSAASIKGNGYTWLLHRFMKPGNGDMRADSKKYSSLVILNTYNYGTPHEFRSGQVSSARKFREKKAALEKEEKGEPSTESDEKTLGIPTIEEAKDVYEPYATTFEPLLAVGVNPSFYVRDYGIYGKEKYLENVWNAIDWSVVEGRFSLSSDKKL